jgi:hypothetical protein
MYSVAVFGTTQPQSNVVSVQMIDAEGHDVQAIKPNADGWPAVNANPAITTPANPLTIRVTITNETSASTSNTLILTLNTTNDARFYVFAEPDESQNCVLQQIDNYGTNLAGVNDFSLIRYETLCLQGADLALGASITLQWRIWMGA